MILFGSIFSGGALSTAPPQRSVSPSGQFVIYGSDAALRSAISVLAEETKAALLATLRRHDGWQTTIVISLQAPQANLPEVPPATLRLSQTDSGLKLELDLIISPTSERPALERQLCRAILVEMIYRNHTELAAGSIYVEPPDWLIEGLLAIAPGHDDAPLIEALRVVSKSMPLENFLEQRVDLLDLAGRVVHRAYSLALIQLLIDLPGGRSGMGQYIDGLALASNDLLIDLRKAFPHLASVNAEILWKAKLARLIAADHQLLSFAQTDAKLSELLDPEDQKSVRLEDTCRTKPDQAGQMALQKLSHGLVSLASRANPLLRPVVEQYQLITMRLAAGKRRGTSEQLTALARSRKELCQRMSKIDDYMNWFEAVKLQTCSGAFDDHLEAEHWVAPTERRKAPLSVYLDAMEEQF